VSRRPHSVVMNALTALQSAKNALLRKLSWIQY